MQTGKAVALIVVTVLVGFLLLRHGGSSRVATPKRPPLPVASTTTTLSAPTTTPSTVPLRTPSSIKLQVLNGVLTGNLAGQFSQKLHANPGYNVLAPDDATAKVLTSTIYILTPGYTGEANALATALGLGAQAVNTTTPPPTSAPIPARDKSAANMILVVGPDLAPKA